MCNRCRRIGDAGAVVQTYRTIRDYRANHYPQLPYALGRRIYPVIVTLEDWYLFGQELPVRLDTQGREGVTGDLNFQEVPGAARLPDAPAEQFSLP